ncbi:hypothetical protein LTR41_000455 [Exophiala xenobiotica]|nr:hypothetical protein LTR41_000455 [Exophiala xenobiotica]KAK5260952.1 hypothetical protein LTR40_003142 [Exophiala xenobiotica]
MPEKLRAEEVNSKTDPSVAKQYDNATPKDEQFKELYELIDGKKISIFSTYRNGVGPVGRSMAVAKRSGPDILYLANKHSKKFEDLESNKEVQITFQDSKTQDWISISGTATTASNDDPRIKELYSSGVSAWFGDLKDGVHDGTWKDPRMSLIEVQKVGMAAMTGSVAQTGVIRELGQDDIQKERV